MSPSLTLMTKLIRDAEALLRDWEELTNDKRGDLERRSTRWTMSGRQVLTHAGLSDFLEEFNTIARDEFNGWQISRLVGVVESAKECVEHGVVSKLKYLLHAEMFDSVVEQTKGLLNSGYKIPAAVLLRITIERWLRDEGEKAGVKDWKTAKASSVNDGLRTAGVFSTAKWRQVQSLMDVGNAAAHGNEGEFKETGVRRMIDFVETNCIAPLSTPPSEAGVDEEIPF